MLPPRVNVGDPIAARQAPEPEFEEAALALPEAMAIDVEGEELPDGSIFYAEAVAADPSMLEDRDHWENLLIDGDDELLEFARTEAMNLIDVVMDDQEARSDRNKQYAQALKEAGLAEPAPGGANFTGASRVTHPMLTQVATDFAADLSRELLPPEGPVGFKASDGMLDEERERAERKQRHMNLQLTEEVEEFYDEAEQLFTQIPFGGSQYLKAWWDPGLNRIRVAFVPLDRVLIPEAATSFYMAERITEVLDYTAEERDDKIAMDEWLDPEVLPAEFPEQTGPEQASDKIEGKSRGAENVDEVARFYQTNLYLEPPGDLEPGWYLITFDEKGQPLALNRNYPQNQDKRIHWLVDFTMIPWRGAQGLGLPHLIGQLSEAATGSVRALLDAGVIATAPTGWTLKGAKLTGQDKQLQVGQLNQIEGPAGMPPGYKVQDLVSPVPANQPSPVLFQLLGMLVEEGKLTASVSTEKMQDARNTGPVGTTLALIEQGSKAYRAIHARMHRSMKRFLGLVHFINSQWLDEEVLRDRYGIEDVTIKDYQGPMDLIPVSDPNIFSDTQRIAQGQAIDQLEGRFPGIFNRVSVVNFILKTLKVPNYDALLGLPEDPRKMEALDENMHVSGWEVPSPTDRPPSPLQAYPGQNHIEHIHVHLLFLSNPILGMSPLAMGAPAMKLLPHIQQHLMLMYKEMMEMMIGRGQPVQPLQPVPPPPQIPPGMPPQQAQQIMQQYQQQVGQAQPDILQSTQQRPSTPLAALAQVVGKRLTDAFMPFMQTLGQLQQQLMQQQQQRQMQQNPQAQAMMMQAQAAMQKNQIDAQADQMDHQVDMAKLQQEGQIKQGEMQLAGQTKQGEMQLRQGELQLRGQDMMADNQLDQARLQLEAQKAGLSMQNDQGKAAADMAKLQMEMQKTAAELNQKAQQLSLDVQRLYKDMSDSERDAALKVADIEAKTAMNESDNQTARDIAAAELMTEAKTNMETGTGINPNPGD